MQKKVKIYTDGSCLGNPGAGGIGILLQYQQHEKRISRGYHLTTNNRMELLAVIEALKLLKESCTVELISDSRYVQQGINQWIDKWQSNNWQTANKKPVKNKDLWLLLAEEIKRHNISWQWVKGHSGNQGNEICDQLAKEGATNPTLEDTGYVLVNS